MSKIIQTTQNKRSSTQPFATAAITPRFHQRTTVYGVGINDAPFACKQNGERRRSYITWSNLIKRCYYQPYLQKKTSYHGCSVVEEWLSYYSFHLWFEENFTEDCFDSEGNVYHLDKDLKVAGNKIYGPDTCMFIPARINSLLLDSSKSRGDYPLGVSRSRNKYKATLTTGDTRKHLGYFITVQEAWDAYVLAKMEYDQTVLDEVGCSSDLKAMVIKTQMHLFNQEANRFSLAI